MSSVAEPEAAVEAAPAERERAAVIASGPAPGFGLSPAQVLGLQRQAGNRAVNRLLGSAAGGRLLQRVTAWLISIDAVLELKPQRQFGPRERWGLHKGSNATVMTSLGQVDVVQRLPGLPDWPTLVSEAEVYEVENQTVCVINRLTWAELKRRRGSPQDLADIDAIERLAEL